MKIKDKIGKKYIESLMPDQKNMEVFLIGKMTGLSSLRGAEAREGRTERTFTPLMPTWVGREESRNS